MPLTASAVAMLIVPAIWAALLLRPELPASDRSSVRTDRLDELSPIPTPANAHPIKPNHVVASVHASNEVTARPTAISASPDPQDVDPGDAGFRPCSQEPNAQLTPVIDSVTPARDGLN